MRVRGCRVCPSTQGKSTFFFQIFLRFSPFSVLSGEFACVMQEYHMNIPCYVGALLTKIQLASKETWLLLDLLPARGRKKNTLCF